MDPGELNPQLAIQKTKLIQPPPPLQSTEFLEDSLWYHQGLRTGYKVTDTEVLK